MTSGREPARVLHVLLHHPAVQTLVAVAREAGNVECHLVGGVLRDRFLGLPGRDLDAVVAGRGEEIAGRLAGRLPARLVHLGGKAFGAFRLLGETAGGPYVLDLWDRDGTSLAQDLARRDFTVDSVALSAPGGELIDPHGGLADLRARVLRATGPASFTADPLRVLRLPRLLVQLPGFTADPATLALARRAAPGLSGVASERVRDELALLFAQPEVARGMAVAGTLEVYPGLWLGRPGEPSPEPAPEPDTIGRLCRELGRLGWAAQRLRELAGGALALAVDHQLARVALSFVNLPAGVDRAATLERVAEAGYLTHAHRRAVARIVPWTRLPAEPIPQRRLLHRLGELGPRSPASRACARRRGGKRQGGSGLPSSWCGSSGAKARRSSGRPSSSTAGRWARSWGCRPAPRSAGPSTPCAGRRWTARCKTSERPAAWSRPSRRRSGPRTAVTRRAGAGWLGATVQRLPRGSPGRDGARPLHGFGACARRGRR